MIYPNRDLKFVLKNSIGGFLGLGATNSVSEIFFDKNEYYLGEKAKVRIVCDNSQCDNPVKYFKFKLHRYYEGRCGRNWIVSGSKYMITQKEGSCSAHSK